VAIQTRGIRPTNGIKRKIILSQLLPISFNLLKTVVMKSHVVGMANRNAKKTKVVSSDSTNNLLDMIKNRLNSIKYQNSFFWHLERVVKNLLYITFSI
jgi:hypothetical protein